MARWEQFEVWVQKDNRWEMIASFRDFEVASAVARNRASRMRLLHVVYENGRITEQDVLAELGTTRQDESLELTSKALDERKIFVQKPKTATAIFRSILHSIGVNLN